MGSRLVIPFLIVLTIWGPFMPLIAEAATYYVNSTGGDDARNTTQAQVQGTPWLTINKCVQAMFPGDTCLVEGIHVNPGGLNQTVCIFSGCGARNGGLGQPITLKSLNPLGASIIVKQPVIASAGRGILISGMTDWVIDGFDIRDDNGTTQAHSIAGIWVEGSGSNRVVIQNNHIHHIARNVCSNTQFGNAGIFAPNANGVTIQGNTINTVGRKRGVAGFQEGGCTLTAGNNGQDQNDHGIYTQDATSMSIIRNIFYDNNRGFNIQLHAGANYKIYNNTLAGRSPETVPSGQLIFWGAFTGVNEVRNNLYYIPRGSAITTFAPVLTSGSVVVTNNLQTTDDADTSDPAKMFTAGTVMTNITGSGNVDNVALGFVNVACTQADGGCEATDFSLAAGSVAINTGTDLGLGGCTGACDIGALEFSGSVTPPPTPRFAPGINLRRASWYLE